MINLLPPQEKENLLLERDKKLAIVLGYTIIIPLICLSLILFSVKLYISGQANRQKSILLATQTKYQTSDFLFYNDLIKKYNADLAKANAFYKKDLKFSDVIKIILGIPRPAELFFSDISIESSQDEKIKIAIFGKSNTRDDLLIFKNNLENSGKIENVYFPPNNWIKAKNIDFYLTLEVLNNEKPK
ncbi:MAG: hypothetical protein HYT35_01750 [Candidatus Staskawiczbacteria bacterium]|nr:hypothetical protein [Candidatus Staskawiczbacteria bacterium]